MSGSHTDPALRSQLSRLTAIAGGVGGVRPAEAVDIITHRHEVFRDLTRPSLRSTVGEFRLGLARVRMTLKRSRKRRYAIQKQAGILDAALSLARLLDEASAGFDRDPPQSPGVLALAAFVEEVRLSEGHREMVAEAQAVRAGLDAVRFRMRIKGPTIYVSGERQEPEYAREVIELFARFKAHKQPKTIVDSPYQSIEVNHVEAAVVDMVARLHPNEFRALAGFAEHAGQVIDSGLLAYERELAFYLAWLEIADLLRGVGLEVGLPGLGTDSGISVSGIFDIALGAERARTKSSVVVNDVDVPGSERLILVTGPNQGGKTTFARAIGQTFYLASLGVPVPARAATLWLADKVLSHFPQPENLQGQVGALEDELLRARELLDAATGASVLIWNETISTTTSKDAITLSGLLMDQISVRGCLAVWVTFLHQLANLRPGIVSYVSLVSDDDPEVRTYQVVRRPPEGQAHALALARKHRLSKADIVRRLAR